MRYSRALRQRQRTTFFVTLTSPISSPRYISIWAQQSHLAALFPQLFRSMLELGGVLGRNLGIKAVFWSPAAVVSGYDYYAEAVAQYAEGAAFPALLCVGFDMSTTGVVETNGLGWLCDQELTFTHAQLPAHEAMRYVVRLVHDLATQGAYDRALELPGLHADEVVVVTPNPDQGTVNARLVNGKEAINSAQ
jgi:hypothetical protein